MRAGEKGFLLLTCDLGNPDRKPLTVAQFRGLTKRMQDTHEQDLDREVLPEDLMALGYSREMSHHIVSLLNEEDLLNYYLRSAKKKNIGVLTRISEDYPHVLRIKLGMDAPASIWYQGDLSILNRRAVALVGSREILEDNSAFAAEVGYQAAKQGYALISGNARGADKIAQAACLENDGFVISIVADELAGKPQHPNLLYLSEMGYNHSFSAQRAISRNRLIHAIPEKTFVAQCDYRIGGTWDGTAKNLQNHWSDVFCFADDSAAMAALQDMGAFMITSEDLKDIASLSGNELNFLTAGD